MHYTRDLIERAAPRLVPSCRPLVRGDRAGGKAVVVVLEGNSLKCRDSHFVPMQANALLAPHWVWDATMSIPVVVGIEIRYETGYWYMAITVWMELGYAG